MACPWELDLDEDVVARRASLGDRKAVFVRALSSRNMGLLAHDEPFWSTPMDGDWVPVGTSRIGEHRIT